MDIGPFGTFHNLPLFSFQHSKDNSTIFNQFFQTLLKHPKPEEKLLLFYIILKFFPNTDLKSINFDLPNSNVIKNFNFPPNNNSHNFQKKKVDDIKHIIATHIPHPINLLLDVGSGTSNIFRSLDAKQSFGIDIPDWSQIKHQPANDIKLISPDNPSFPFDDSSSDLVICIYSLHHFTHLDKMLAEIVRCMKPNSHLLILDHDITTSKNSLIVDLVHIFYEFKRTHQFPNKDSYFSRYYNIHAWISIMKTYKLKLVIQGYLPSHLNYLFKFFAIFQK